MFRSYSIGEKLVAGLLALVLGVCVAVYIGAQSMKIERRGIELEVQSTINQIRSGLDVVDGVATSLRALPFSRLDPSRVSSYARAIVGNYVFITGFGRFETVREPWLDGFVEGMRKLPETKDYSLWRLGPGGERVAYNTAWFESPPTDTGHWHPVTLTAGTLQDNPAKQLEGLDIGSVESLKPALREATYSGKTMLARFPQVWAQPGHILALRISYGAHLLPDTIKERQEQSSGGYWLALDIDKLGVIEGEKSNFGLSIGMFDTATEFETTAISEELYRRDDETSDLLFSSWFKSHEWLSSFSVGDQTLLLKASSKRGLTKEGLFSSLLCAVLVLVFAGVMLILNGKRRYEKKLRESRSAQLFQEQHRASVTLASIRDAVITTDVAAKVLYANNAAENMLGFQAQETRGKLVTTLPVLGTQLAGCGGDKRSVIQDFQTEVVVNIDGNLVGPEGETLFVSQTISPLLDINGERSGSVIVLRDVSAEKELTRTLEHRLNHDPLTGLANRVKFESCLTHLFETAADSDIHAICYIDLDRFKQINDTCGHAAGDRLLVELSAAMQSKVRNEDVLARLGGDEFGIVLRHCEPAAAESVVRRIHNLFSEFSFENSGKLYPVRGSIGLVTFRPSKTTLENIQNVADAACYAAKRNGSNSIEINSAHDVVDSAANVEELWVPRIQGMLDQGGFELHYQPIVAIGQNDCLQHAAHFEFLLRMRGGDGQLVYPGNFIKPAERCGLMIEIDHWVIKNSLACIASLPAPMGQYVYSINLSGHAVKNTDLFSFIVQQFEHSETQPSQVCFEVNEGEVINNFEAAKVLFGQLREYGCKVALDDFGAGLSSFSALMQLPVDFIKIDDKILAGASTSDSSRQLLRAIADFSKSLGMQTIAEKVETKKALEILVECRVDFAQGYVISRPQPVASLGSSGAVAAA